MEKLELTKERIEELKKKYKNIWVYTSQDKKYWAIFRKPSRVEFSLFMMTTQQSGEISASEELLNSCFIEGNKELLTDDEYFYGLLTPIQSMLEFKSGEIKKY